MGSSPKLFVVDPLYSNTHKSLIKFSNPINLDVKKPSYLRKILTKIYNISFLQIYSTTDIVHDVMNTKTTKTNGFSRYIEINTNNGISKFKFKSKHEHEHEMCKKKKFKFKILF
jgi:hypothetical protein